MAPAAPRGTHAAIAALVGSALALAIASCAVHRLSDDFRCENNGDCGDGRACSDGFCVDGQGNGNCPDECSSCNLGQRTCRIDCTASRPCGSVKCPDGFECDVRCNNAGACGEIDCAEGDGCEISCSGAASCGGIHCGKGACTVDCTGVASCPFVDCADACRCDLDCSSAMACPAASCPEVAGTLCTENKDPGASCDSSVSVVCDTCF